MKTGNLILGAGTVLTVLVSLFNSGATTFNFFGLHATLPAGALIFSSFAFGFLCTLSLLIARYSAGNASSQRLVEWQVQDEKLLKQVQSDREKQLEAKIATLEAALQKALKR